MVANLLDIDEAMLTQAAAAEGAYAIFFDFAAAFPSIEHEFFQAFFRSLGWPAWLCQFVRSLYWHNYCDISLGGGGHEGFGITRGTRQGCPLSPLLFAAASDFYLRKLARRFPAAILRAWADDLAMVLPAGLRHLPAVQAFFDEFARISGLALNVPKTVLVPLDPVDLAAARTSIAAVVPGWAGTEVATAAKYLGVYVGPGRQDASWQAPLAKYLARAELWGKLGVGLHLSLQAYRVYIASVLLFVGQFEALPAGWPEHERRACTALLPGPNRWITPACLKELGAFSFPLALKDIASTVVAAKARVLKWEAQGALHIRTRARILAGLSYRPTDVPLAHLAKWHQWRERAFLLQIVRADDQVQQARRALPAAPDWWGEHQLWQKNVGLLIHPPSTEEASRLWRRKLDKWPIELLPGWRLGRAQQAMAVIGQSCQPRVTAACIRTQLNGWCTGRRFQRAMGCRLGCGHDEDSIQHLAFCPVQRQLLARYLNIAPAPASRALESFLLLGGGHTTEEGRQQLRLRALGVYALYRVHNLMRTVGMTASDIAGAFREYLQECRRGSAHEE